MRVFLTYASEQREIAERIAIGLRHERHLVFFARDDLPAGDSYDDRIRHAIRRSHMLVFLASKESLAEGGYALTELGIARHQWPTPAGRVLPVIIDNTPIEDLPPYLRAVTVVPEGDVVPETLAAVARQARERLLRWLRRLSLAVGVLLLLVGIGRLSPRGAQSIDSVQVRRVGDGDEFLFAVTLRNRDAETITTVDVGVETDREDVQFGTSTEWFALDPGEIRRLSVSATLDAPASQPGFRWRMCWRFVPTADLILKPREADIDAFLSRYRHELCDRWQRWAPTS
jgi:hypothetical protein